MALLIGISRVNGGNYLLRAERYSPPASKNLLVGCFARVVAQSYPVL